MLPSKAILKEDVFSYIKKKQQYAKKHELVEVVEIKDHVAIVVNNNGEWFPVNVNKLIIQ